MGSTRISMRKVKAIKQRRQEEKAARLHSISTKEDFQQALTPPST